MFNVKKALSDLEQYRKAGGPNRPVKIILPPTAPLEAARPALRALRRSGADSFARAIVLMSEINSSTAKPDKNRTPFKNMTIVRKLNNRAFSVIHEGRERGRYANGTAKANEADAVEFAQRYLSPTNSLTRDTLLFGTGAQTITWITDDGDNSEPHDFGTNSILRIADDSAREIVLTGEEMENLVMGWICYMSANHVNLGNAPLAAINKLKRGNL